MRKVNIFFSLAPAPMFLTGFVISLYTGPSICGSFIYEMPAMWLVMFLAHISPWLIWWQQRQFQKFQTLPDKQQ